MGGPENDGDPWGGGNPKTHRDPLNLGRGILGTPQKGGGGDGPQMWGGGPPKPPHLARRCLSWFLPALM